MSETRAMVAGQLVQDLGSIERTLGSLPQLGAPQQASVINRVSQMISPMSQTIAALTEQRRTTAGNSLGAQWALFKQEFQNQRYGGCIGIIIVCKRHAQAIVDGG
jgi:hypothetical protein